MFVNRGVCEVERRFRSGISPSSSEMELQSYTQYDHDNDSDGGLSPPPAYNSHHSTSYETKYQKSLRHYLTREALPMESHYRNLASVVNGQVRPTLEELHEATFRGESKTFSGQEEDPPAAGGKKVFKLGWIKGVMIPCLLNIWGVMLFLRVPWVIGQAGIAQGLCIVCLANIVTFITTLSMSAVATNGRIRGGGIYYMISRSLGPEFGASIGLMFTLANSIAAATYIIGFVNAIQGMCEDYFNITEIIPGLGGGVNDIRVLSVITLGLVLIPAIIGMDWVTRVQIGLLVILVASQIDFIIGAFMGPLNEAEEAKGFVGLSARVMLENTKEDFRFYQGDQSFFGVFGVFFPAVTGIVAGANLSGDLKDASSAIPKGTLCAVILTFFTYIFYPILVGCTFMRDALGNETVYIENSLNITDPFDNPTFGRAYCPLDEKGQSICKYGTQNDFKVMEVIAAWGPLIYIGCFAATLSSAIASLVGAPRILQALGKDKLYPVIHYFSVGVGDTQNPIRGYMLVAFLCFLCIMIGDLNAVSALLTNFFLAAYALINFSTFHASFVKSPGWRPAFKYYNCWFSLLGGVMCVAVMFLIEWVTAFCTFIILLLLYLFVSYRKPDVNWGSSTQAQTYNAALKSSYELVYVEDHVKNFRPQILLFVGHPGARPSLVHFAYTITKNIAMMTCASVVRGPLSQRMSNTMTRQAYRWFAKHNVKSFYSVVEGEQLDVGAKSLYQLCGLGKLKPNIVLMGYKGNWQKCDRKELKAYFNTVDLAIERYFGMAILRVAEGLDFSNILSDDDVKIPSSEAEGLNQHTLSESKDEKASSDSLQQDGTGSVHSTPPQTPVVDRTTSAAEKPKDKKEDLYKGVGGVELPKDVLNNITRFEQKQKKGTIDVWWCYDDGGLTILLPFILSTKSLWSNCKLRIFTLANRKDELDTEQRSMANLLGKFRIDYSDMIVIPDVAKKASQSSKNNFDKLIKRFVAKQNEDIRKEDEGILISEAELLSQQEKTNRHIRLRELLEEHSKNASMIVMTLPMPRKNSVSATLYMAWLETLTKDMPPFMLVRGNQTSVLTFYS